MLLKHRQYLLTCGALEQVQELVGHEAIVDLFESTLSKVAVFQLGSIGEEVGPNRVCSVLVDQIVRTGDVAERFRHLSPILQPVTVADHSLRHRKIRCQQEQWIVDAVKLCDVFPNYVHCVSDIVIQASVLCGWVAQHSQIVGESVEPDIDGLSRIIRHFNTPAETTLGPTDRDFKLLLGKVGEHFIADSGRLDIILGPLDNFLLQSGVEPKDIVLLSDVITDFTCGGYHVLLATLTLHEILLWEECLLIGTVEPTVTTFDDVTVFCKLLPHSLHA